MTRSVSYPQTVGFGNGVADKNSKLSRLFGKEQWASCAGRNFKIIKGELRLVAVEFGP